MKRNLYKLEKYNFDLSYIDCIKLSNDDQILIKYNGNNSSFNFKSKSDRDVEYEKLIDALVKANLVLLYDNDRDLINYSNVIRFDDPVFNESTNKMSFAFQFKNGFVGQSILNLNDTGDDISTVKIKMQKIYDELFNIWETNEPKLHKPFHKIDLKK